MGDGCGGTLNCGGACPAPQVCGGGGVPSQCGGGGPTADGGNCTPTKTSCAAGDCGPIADGCGGLLQCGGCSAPQLCGGGVGGPGTPSRCGGGTLPDGGAVCTPKTCTQAGANCGPVGDGCGGLIASCGTCPFGQICGGGGTASVCGPVPDGGVADAGQVPCDGGITTTLTGTVYAPNGTEPLYNAIVYVPSTAVLPFTAGVSCNQCGADITGTPVAKAFTAPDGTFTLQNVPPGTNVPIVIQLGRWRRQITVANVPACSTSAIAASQTRLPRNQGEGDIPLTAIATGNVDALECVLRKVGIDDAEFTRPSNTGRVRIYRANGANAGGSTPSWTTLWSSLNTLKTYDIVLLPCEGFPDTDVNPAGTGTSAPQQNMIDYANAGGRVYATHYSYTWLSNTNTAANGPAPWSGTGSFVLDQGHPADPNTVTGAIDTSFTKGQAFAQWLQAVGALSNVSPPKITMNISRHDMNAVVSPAQSWITVDPVGAPPAGTYPNYTNAPQHYTFNTPVGVSAANQCGRVLYSDFHVQNAATSGVRFPNECTAGALTAQEKVLEFMLFDLANCISPDVPPTCTPKTCQQLGVQCGPAGDGCGGTLACGSCSSSQTCGGGGTPSVCGGPSCTPTTCVAKNANCGQLGDGCGGTLSCGTCASGQNCGGGGAPNQCGVATCTPKTCGQLGIACGTAGDGCGNLLNCGTCSNGQSCGGGGTPNQCGTPTCTKRTCPQVNANCGPIADGCGGLLDCGPCTPPQTCGGGGTANQCGQPTCSPSTCEQMGISCGPSGDGCGGILDCGTCPSYCGPRTCLQANANCGLVADGCGGTLNCGVCTAPDSCGGGGTPNQCGAPTCTPRTCQQMGVTCGPSGDGCGSLLDCGKCPSSCTPRTCQQAGASCGQIADNCGGLINCGACTPPQSCGGGGTPNLCGGNLIK